MRSIITLAGWAWALVALPQVTDSAVGFGWSVVLVFSAAAVGLAWLGRSLACPTVFRRGRWRWAWCSAPAAMLGCLVLAATGWGFAARVALCEEELRAFAEDVRQGRDGVGRLDTPRRVGLFWVEYAAVDGDEVVLITAHGFLDACGLAYRPSGPPDLNDTSYEHLWGGWYHYQDDF